MLNIVFRQGERVRGPHVIECHANINRVKIRQVVYFPNGVEHDFVVESTSKANELVANICRDLKFLPDSANGLSLYLETGKKRKKGLVVSLTLIVFVLVFVRDEYTSNCVFL